MWWPCQGLQWPGPIAANVSIGLLSNPRQRPGLPERPWKGLPLTKGGRSPPPTNIIEAICRCSALGFMGV